MIHSTAIIHPRAKIPQSTRVGPYAVIDEHVELGENCEVGPHVYLTGRVKAGSGNKFHMSCVIGHEPQDLKYKDEPTRVIIGDNNVFREHCTVHRANKVEEDTTVGSNTFLMCGCHIGHNSHIHDGAIIANAVLLGGHVTIGERAFLSAGVLIHQFVRVGMLCIMQGGTKISKDLPPFTVGRGSNGVCGLNIIGLRRAGFTLEERTELKKVYRTIFRSGMRLQHSVEKCRELFTSEKSKIFLDFITTSKRGLCADTGKKSNEEDGVE